MLCSASSCRANTDIITLLRQCLILRLVIVAEDLFKLVFVRFGFFVFWLLFFCLQHECSGDLAVNRLC